MRWRILALLFLATVINFVDRQTLSVVAPVLRDEFQFSNQQYGLIVAFFQLGMMLGEFPMGMLMDRWGAKRGFTFAIVWWSVASAMHGLANSVTQFGALRFWLGTGECGNFSGSTKVVGEWFPPKERALGVGIFNGGTMVGSIIAPPLVVWLVHLYGWRGGVRVPKPIGVVLGVFWVQKEPPKNPGVGPAGGPATKTG